MDTVSAKLCSRSVFRLVCHELTSRSVRDVSSALVRFSLLQMFLNRLEFRNHCQIFFSSSRALRSDQLMKSKYKIGSAEEFVTDGLVPNLGKTTDTRDLSEYIEWTDIRIESEIET